MLRSTALSFEACVSEFGERRRGYQPKQLEDPYIRRDLQAELNDEVRERSRYSDLDEDIDYLLLRDTRNMMLHTSVPRKKRLMSMFENPAEMVALIERVCGRILADVHNDIS